jgi:hypothetical protein
VRRRRRQEDRTADTIPNTLEWLQRIPDDATLLVSEGGKSIGQFRLAAARWGEEPLEEVVLRLYGSGRYSILPAYGGRFHKGISVCVGNVEEFGRRRREEEELREEIERLRRLRKEHEDSKGRRMASVTELAPQVVDLITGPRAKETEEPEADDALEREREEDRQEREELKDAVDTLEREQERDALETQRLQDELAKLKEERATPAPEPDGLDLSALVNPAAFGALLWGGYQLLTHPDTLLDHLRPLLAPKQPAPPKATTTSPSNAAVLDRILSSCRPSPNPRGLGSDPSCRKVRFGRRFQVHRPATPPKRFREEPFFG